MTCVPTQNGNYKMEILIN